MYVDFETTKKREATEILTLLEASNLKTFCSKKQTQNKTLDLLAMEFKFSDIFSDDSIETSIKGTHLTVSKSNIASIFETNSEGVDPFIYKEDRWVESFVGVGERS